METRANYVLVGAFVFAAALALIAATVWLGQSEFNRDFDEYDVLFEGPVTLEEGADVRYIGIKVGDVRSVRIDRADPSRVRARVRISDETPVKTDSTAAIDFAGITGVTFVQINSGSPTAQTLTRQPGQPVPVIPAERTQLAELVSGGREILTGAQDFVDRANALVTEDNIDAASRILANTDRFAAALADEEGLLAEASATLAELRDAADRIDTAADSFTSVTEDASRSLTSLTEEADLLVADLRSAAQSADTTLTEGGRALASAADTLDGPVADVLGDLRETSRDLRVLISRVDSVARDFEAEPQSLVVGAQVPYEERR